MAHKSNVDADWWIDLFILCVFPFGLFDRTQQSFSFGHCHALGHLGSSLLFLGNYSFVFADGTVVQLDKALRNLEEILVRLVWSKLDVKVENRLGLNDLSLRFYSEGVLDPLVGGLVQNVQQSPVHLNRERELVFNGQLLALGEPTCLPEGKVNEVGAQDHISTSSCNITKHFFVQNNLSGVINWYLLIHL